MPCETECKYLNVPLDAVRRSLHEQGGLRHRICFEKNRIFDDASGSLRQAGLLLRVRENGDHENGEYTVTFKRPAPGTHKAQAAGVKMLEEYETRVDDPAPLVLIFETLGYTARLRYEKVRETWEYGNCLVCLDHLPFGDFVELEGSRQAITEAARRLGLDRYEASTASYHDLHRQFCVQEGLAVQEDFVFSPAQRMRLSNDIACQLTGRAD